jgi:uncharacterized protein YegP (UPF0339 family)
MTENIDKIRMYEAEDGWRWRRRDGGNGEITGAATQGYATKGAALDNIHSTQREPYVIDDSPEAQADEAQA